MADIFAVMQDGMGAHEPEAVMSLWLTRDGAETECARMNALNVATYPKDLRNVPDFFVTALPLETPSPDLNAALT